MRYERIAAWVLGTFGLALVMFSGRVFFTPVPEWTVGFIISSAVLGLTGWALIIVDWEMNKFYAASTQEQASQGTPKDRFYEAPQETNAKEEVMEDLVLVPRAPTPEMLQKVAERLGRQPTNDPRLSKLVDDTRTEEYQLLIMAYLGEI